MSLQVLYAATSYTSLCLIIPKKIYMKIVTQMLDGANKNGMKNLWEEVRRCTQIDCILVIELINSQNVM